MYKLIKTRLLLSTALFTVSTLAQAVVTNINFDTDSTGAVINAPDLFSAATPLTDLYSGLGVNFSALERKLVTVQVPHNGVLTARKRNEFSPTGSGMGAILNDSSGFGGPAKSGDNFLAFNGETTFGSHFWRISFDNAIGYFEIDRRRGADPDNNRNIQLDAYNVDGNLVGLRSNPWTRSINWSSDGPSHDRSSFKSETEISYVNIGHALDYNIHSSLRSTPWSIVYDDLVFGDFADARSGTQFLGPAIIPLPGGIWFLLTGILGFSSLRTKRKLTEA